MYNLQQGEVVGALGDAARNGVVVQILIEDAQLDPEKKYHVTNERLMNEGGIPSFVNMLGMTDDQKNNNFIAGVALKGRGLFHLKLRRFARPGIVEMQTGSLNPSEEAMQNDETVIEIKNAALQVCVCLFCLFVLIRQC